MIRIQTEMNGGNHLFDVTNGSAEQAAALKKIGAIDPYFSPSANFSLSRAKIKMDFLLPFMSFPSFSATTSTWFKRAEAPKTYDDLLHPKWKSNMFL